jgi:rSAM/selenodomain-associated transferase 1
MVDVQGQDVVAVLTRAPSAGGKTRLFRELGWPPDPEVLAALLLDTLDAVDVAGCRRVVCFTPASAETELRALVPAGVSLLPQREGDLGERMAHAFDDLLAQGAASVVLIGSDLPGIDPSVVAVALRTVRERPGVVVLGPARDGGYYLVAAARTPAALFSGMTWSTPAVLADTEERARAANIEVVRVAAAADIDTADDLRALLRGSAPAPRLRTAINGRGGWQG